jgi:hypothetical protein
MSNLQNFVDYYQSLLIYQYSEQYNALETVNALMTELFMAGVPYDLERAFDLDTAVGEQLTILGKYVGVPRNVQGYDPTRLFCEFITYITSDLTDRTGMRTYTTLPSPSGQMYSYMAYSNGVFTLTDAQLRILIQLKIAFNVGRSTYYLLKTILYDLFDLPSLVYDNENMSMTILVPIDYGEIFKLAALLGIFPVPACVLLHLIQNVDPTTIFGFCDYSNYLLIASKGFCSYGNIINGSMISYRDSLI